MDLKILHIDDKCTGCGACVSICPKNALRLDADAEGFYFPKLDENSCVNCRLCERSCQVFDPAEESDGNMRVCYMGKASSREIVAKSSSGGAFSLLANMILRDGGVVYGARYDYENERLIQDSTENCPLDSLRKSKYIESYTGQIFKSVGENLILGKQVLYVGTPCQIEGLSKYLATKHIDNKNLLLVRFICHGVPANEFFTEYKHYEEKKHKSKIVSFDFRPKTWRFSDWKMTFENGQIEKGPYYYYYYYYYFQSSNILRKSCYNCRRVLTDVADITIGDFWGINKYEPENTDNEGISLIMVHSSKGHDVLKTIDSFKFIEEIPLSAVEYVTREVNERRGFLLARENFMKDVAAKGYMGAAKAGAGTIIFKMRAKNKVRKIFNKICKRK